MFLFVDFNSFFASVEQQLHPELRGRPVAVVPTLAETTSCIAASYEAKAFKIKTGTPVWEARQRCSSIVFIMGDHKNYIEFHNRILQSIDKCVPVSHVMSIDEMACELMGREKKIENARELAFKIKKQLAKDVGEFVKCSIGIAPNRFLAKVASDMHKPDGLTIVEPHDIPKKFFVLKPRDFPGIGPNMEKRLLRAGIDTTVKLYAQDMEALKNIWGGIGGEYFYRVIRGEEIERVESVRKSVSHSHVLPPNLRTEEGAYAVLQKLLHKAAIRLRKYGFWCRHMNIAVRYVDRDRWTEGRRILETQDDLSLLQVLTDLWNSPRPQKVPMKVSVWLSELVPDAQHSYNFFENEKHLRLSRTLDQIHTKFGRSAIYFLGTHKARTAAPIRISFTNIPELDDGETYDDEEA